MASVTVARKTKRWHRWRNQRDDHTPPSVNIRHDYAGWYFRCHKASWDDTYSRFPDCPIFLYEHLVDHWDDAIVEIQRHIGVDPLPLRPKTLKQDRRPIREIITNYNELKASFQGSEWANLFETAEANDEDREVA